MRYKLEFLPIAEKDIRGIALYIAHELNAPVAAANLLREIRRKANSLCAMPYIYREYLGEPPNETIYRAMPVKNHIAFHTVCEESKTVEVHRVLYVRMDLDALMR